MLKRILSVLLCAALLLGGTALAAKEDDYTLPELLYQQFAVQDYPIRGSVAVTASGTASWLDFLLPLTASTLHVRLLNLEDSDDFQYQVFSQDDSGNQQGLTQLYRVGDTLYLRTDVLSDVLLSMPLAESAKSNPSFYSVLAEMMAQPDILWESMWQPALEEYLNELELWLADYAAEPDTMTENGELVMRVSYVIPADDVKEQTKLMWKQALYDETLLTLLRPMMTEEQQAAYLNPALGYFYDACIDALPLSGDLRLSRKFSARGDTLSVAVALPLPQNAWGYTTLTFRQEGSTTALVLNSATQTLTFSMASADGNQNAITGSISSVPAAFVTDAKTLQAKFTLTSQHSETQDSDGTRHDDSAWTLTIEPDTDGAEAADLVTFEPITAELSLQYSTESREGAPIQLRADPADAGRGGRDEHGYHARCAAADDGIRQPDAADCRRQCAGSYDRAGIAHTRTEHDTHSVDDGRIISKIAAVHHKLRRFLSEKEKCSCGMRAHFSGLPSSSRFCLRCRCCR